MELKDLTWWPTVWGKMRATAGSKPAVYDEAMRQREMAYSTVPMALKKRAG